MRLLIKLKLIFVYSRLECMCGNRLPHFVFQCTAFAQKICVFCSLFVCIKTSLKYSFKQYAKRGTRDWKKEQELKPLLSFFLSVVFQTTINFIVQMCASIQLPKRIIYANILFRSESISSYLFFFAFRSFHFFSFFCWTIVCDWLWRLWIDNY